MLALIYVRAIWSVATPLYVIVNNFAPDRRLAMVLQFLILAVGAAAIAKTVAALASAGRPRRSRC
jgi:hypothetical protein